METRRFKKKKIVKKPGWVLVLQKLRDEMPSNKAWSTEKIARCLNKKLPATRRLLRILVSAGLILEVTKGRYKYYALPRASVFTSSRAEEKSEQATLF